MTIKQQVIQDALDYSDEPEDQLAYIEDVQQHGCSSGIVSGLIYYSDTAKFYENHNDEIWDIVNESADSRGYSVPEFIANLNGDFSDDATFKNLLVWFAYEETAYQIDEDDLLKSV